MSEAYGWKLPLDASLRCTPTKLMLKKCILNKTVLEWLRGNSTGVDVNSVRFHWGLNLFLIHIVVRKISVRVTNEFSLESNQCTAPWCISVPAGHPGQASELGYDFKLCYVPFFVAKLFLGCAHTKHSIVNQQQKMGI